MSDVTILVPRKDLSDQHWNDIQAYTRRLVEGIPYVTGTDPVASQFFSMSRALNAARTQATTPKLFLTPVDYLVTPQIIEQISRMLDDHPWWGPFQSVHQLWDGPTAEVLAGAEPRLDMPGDRTVMCMAAIAVRADVFDAVKGMDPRFEGYAPEDAALRLKLIQLYGQPPIPQPEPVFELWTDRSARDNFETTGKFYQDIYLTADSPQKMLSVIQGQPDI